jgi:NhaP-type Na+/H+ or K+/H+ antiporter
VATLSVFGVQKVEPNLNALVYGESIINDAMSIVLYRAFVTFFTEEVTGAAVGIVIGNFIGLSIFSVAIGGLATCLCALALKHGHFHGELVEVSATTSLLTLSHPSLPSPSSSILILNPHPAPPLTPPPLPPAPRSA